MNYRRDVRVTWRDVWITLLFLLSGMVSGWLVWYAIETLFGWIGHLLNLVSK